MAFILMSNLLKQPYPTEEPVSRMIIKSVVVGIFIALFLILFQPFGLDDWQTPFRALKIVGFGAVTSLVMLVNYLVLPALLPRYFSDERWTVGKEIIRTILFITIIALGNRLYLGWLIENQLYIGGWFWMVGVTFLIGIFPTVGLVLLNYITQLKKYSQAADALPVHAPPPAMAPEQNDPLRATGDSVSVLLADNEKDKLVVPTANLVFIESSDNYCTVVYLKNGQPTKPLLRSSLSRLEKQITQPYIVRCHRSYVVNLNRVERVTGNAQGYKLHMQDGQFQIPVARQYNDSLVHQLKAQV